MSYFIAMCHSHYDCSDVLGLFSSEQKATEHLDPLLRQLTPTSGSSYYIEEWEPDGHKPMSTVNFILKNGRIRRCRTIDMAYKQEKR